MEVVEMTKRRKMEVLCVQETKWKGDRARKMAEGYKLLHAGGDGRSNGVGIIVNVEISKEMLRVERWQGRIIAVWMMIRQHKLWYVSSAVMDPRRVGRRQRRRLSEKRWRGWPV